MGKPTIKFTTPVVQQKLDGAAISYVKFPLKKLRGKVAIKSSLDSGHEFQLLYFLHLSPFIGPIIFHRNYVWAGNDAFRMAREYLPYMSIHSSLKEKMYININYLEALYKTIVEPNRGRYFKNKATYHASLKKHF
jgi:hypothetical protein